MKPATRLIFAGGLILCLIVLLGFWKTSKQPAGNVQAPAVPMAVAPPAPAAPVKPDVAVAQNGTDHSFAADCDQILALLASDNPLDQAKVYRELLPALVRRNPQAAADFVTSPAAAKWRIDLMPAVAQVWTDVNVDDAEKWAAQISAPNEKNIMIGVVGLQEANNDPNRAMQVLEDSAMNPDRREVVVVNLAQQWANQSQNLQTLYSEIDKLPAGADRDNLFAQVAKAQCQSNPAQAAEMVASEMSPGPDQYNTALYVLHQWARTDMGAAAAWASQFPAGDMQDGAQKAISGNLYGAYMP